MLAHYGSNVAPLAVAAPLDYVPWVKPIDDFARRTDLTGTKRWLLISGKGTPRAAETRRARLVRQRQP